MLEDFPRWRRHSPMSDPGGGAALYDLLPNDEAALCRAVQGLIVHADWASAYGLPETHFGPDARTTLPLERRLAEIVRADKRPLTAPRPVPARTPGTCRDYALMLCSVLRHRRIPARVRCGFATYFDAPWEDHWLCEFWQARDGRWRRMDAQLDEVQQRLLGVDFDISDVPAEKFITAGEAWRRCRAGADDTHFGHGETKGLWFVRVNVMRDHYSLNRSELSAWDGWRQAGEPHRSVCDADRRATDALAWQPDAAKVEIAPPWLG